MTLRIFINEAPYKFITISGSNQVIGSQYYLRRMIYCIRSRTNNGAKTTKSGPKLVKLQSLEIIITSLSLLFRRTRSHFSDGSLRNYPNLPF